MAGQHDEAGRARREQKQKRIEAHGPAGVAADHTTTPPHSGTQIREAALNPMHARGGAAGAANYNHLENCSRQSIEIADGRRLQLVQVVATFVAGFATVTALVALAQVALAPDLHLRRRVEAWRRAGGAAAVSRGHGTCAVVGGAAIWRRSTPTPPPPSSLHVVC